jgi:predicted negative regulator of RcsB-dependent stress response
METSEEQKPRRTKFWIYLVLILLIFGGGWYGYTWFKDVRARDISAQQYVMDAQNFQVLRETVQKEYSRCENFIAQQKGDFGSFEYCKRFIDWVNQ